MKDKALILIFSEAAKRKRKELELTQEDVADAVGISVRSLQMIESGKRLPGFSAALRLTNRLGLDYELFLRTV